MKRFAGKVALVTGAASGIGASCAERLAREGAKVFGVDLQEPVTGEAWIQAEKASSTEFLSKIDISDEAAVDRAVAAARAAFGPITVLINAAGISGAGAAHELTVAEWDKTLNVNLKGCFLTTKYVAPMMLEGGCGSIVHIASVVAFSALENLLPYCTSKGGVIAMTQAMAWDYGHRGIRVNAVCPGTIETPMTAGMKDTPEYRYQHERWSALRRLGQPSEIAAAVAFLASDDASFVTGHSLLVDGGWTAGRGPVPAWPGAAELTPTYRRA